MSEEIEKIECEKAIKMLLEYLDHELGAHDHKVMDKHLHACRSCFTRMEFEQRLREVIKEKSQEKASDDFRKRVRNITDLF